MADEREVLDFGVAVDIKEAVRQVEKFQKEMSASLKTVAQAAEKMGKTAETSSNKAARASDAHNKAVRGVATAYGAEAAEVQSLHATIKALEAEAKNVDDEKAMRIQQRIGQLKKERSERQRERRGLDKKQGFIGRDQAKEIKSSLKESGNALVEPLRAFLSKDAKGFVEASMKGVGKTFSKDTIKAMAKGGALAKQQGAVMDIAGRRKGGLRGLAMRGSGKAHKMMGAGMAGMGKALGGITKALKPLGKLVPIFGMLGGALMSLVKLFIDADSMVKEFNKGVLDSASTVGYLADYGSRGMERLEKNLEEVGKAAMDDSFNNALGITKDQHLQVLNVLNQEGASLSFIRREAMRTNQSMGEMTQSIVAAGVAYSRQLGVPMQEINQLQAEMITEMAMGARETEMAFAQITRAAGESGVAGNKFFQMIKGVSQDLSVWNMRMEDSVDLLGRLTKVMSPRSAQKFFQEMSSGFSQLGRQDLLKQSMLAGAQATKEANQGTLERMQGELAKTLNVEVGEISGKGYDEIYKMIQQSGVDQSQMGTMIERLNQMTTVRQGMKGGTYGQAYATRHADTAGQLDILKGALERFGGTLENPTSMAIGAVADSLGKSPEFVEALANLARTAKAQRKLLMDQAKTPEEKKKIEGMSEKELINELGKKMLPKSDEEMRDMALKASEKQGQMTQDLLTKFSNFVDNFMVQFYYLVMDIYQILKDFYRSVMALPFFEEQFDKADRASGLEGTRLVEMLKTGLGENQVSSAIKSQFSGADFLRLVKNSDLSKEGKERFASKHEDMRRLKAGDYKDPATMLREMGMNVSKVFSKALWERNDKESSDAFIKALGIQKSAVPKMMAATDPEKLTGPPKKDEKEAGSKDEIPSPEVKIEVPKKRADVNRGFSPPEIQSVPSDEETKQASALAAYSESAARTGQDQLQVMKTRGIVINQQGAKNIGDEFLTALRKGLYEYYLYSGTDRSTVAKAFGAGGPTASTAGKLKAGAAMGSPDLALTQMAQARPNAKGGMVTGIANGMAVVAAQGEGLASVGRGERIIPAGGGGSPNITIPVNGVGGQDLARIIEAKVVEGIREYKRREKLY